MDVAVSGVRLRVAAGFGLVAGEQILGGAIRPAKTRPNSIERNHRSAIWFAVKRQGGGVILHHRHVRSVRDWSPAMDGIQATIWASRTTTDLDYGRPSRTTVAADVRTRVAEIAI